ncbi:MAG TPA: hypothetical protein V6C81_13435 [Planktothrix sp.]|jgi:hypothetical protein
MPTEANTRVIDQSQRRWANGKLSQFCGRFERDSRSDLWFAKSTPEEERKRISAALLLMPAQLRHLAVELQLTVSTNWGKTVRGDDATLYGEFTHNRKAEFSPHLEFGRNTLRCSLLVPHMVHELAHLFWNALGAKEQAEYAHELVTSSTATSIEVTSYAHDKLNNWRHACTIKEPYGPVHRKAFLKTWAEESYAESAAGICVNGYTWKITTVDLRARRATIRNCTGLRLPARISADEIALLPALAKTK